MIEQPVLDSKRKPVRLGDLVRCTVIIDHGAGLYTISLLGKVVDFFQGDIVVLTSNGSRSVKPWESHNWSVVGHEGFS